MVLRTTGVNGLALMMQADRAWRGAPLPDTDWLLFGPVDPDAVEDATEPHRLAAE